FSEAIAGTKDLSITQVIHSLDAELGPHFFPANDNYDPRACPSCKSGRLGLRLGRFGAFIGCSNYPECRYTRRLGVDNGNGNGEHEGPKLLGSDPASGLPVTLRHGPYGHYVQLGDSNGNGNGNGIAHAEEQPPTKGKGKGKRK